MRVRANLARMGTDPGASAVLAELPTRPLDATDDDKAICRDVYRHAVLAVDTTSFWS
jgi:hypothetical protein